MNYKEVFSRLCKCKVELHTAELHGLVTGWLCAGASPKEASGALAEWLGEEVTDESLPDLTAEIAQTTLIDLQDVDFGFYMMLPDDETSITERQQSISHWCRGFLAGFGTAGRFQQSELAQDVAEIFTDMARIANLEDEIPDDDENETDLMEISEYVRMSALFIYTECASKAVH